MGICMCVHARVCVCAGGRGSLRVLNPSGAWVFTCHSCLWSVIRTLHGSAELSGLNPLSWILVSCSPDQTDILRVFLRAQRVEHTAVVLKSV